ncbi:hypothetical protein [Paenibacillus wynnii]|uniref:Uncharacterized protein n=1 Tax=Paenibacillus wynnii TaxID=268407 RepID=A0A098M7E4_9BACL|nr:hypothetical protein [Paenibacillus wynnii]KGE18455.1 hypothetical protein PWYN_28610 [Paenibacillus wynnii]
MTIIFSHNKKLLDQLTIAKLQLDDYKRREHEMLAHLGRAGQGICKLNHEIGRLREENEQLQDERKMLLEHIERTIDEQKAPELDQAAQVLKEVSKLVHQWGDETQL